MKHYNTLYRYAQGGFGQISLDLVHGTVVKKARKTTDTSIQNEVQAYAILYQQPLQSDHIPRILKTFPGGIELERADCDLGFIYRNVYQPLSFYVLVAVQCLEALSFIHQAGLVHCDIKPSNVLLHFDVRGNVMVKICDFGLSHSATQNKAVIKGTSGYTDPRAILLKYPLTALSDLWSLGITLLVCACHYEHIDDLQTKHLKQLADTTADCDEFIKSTVSRLPIPQNALGMIARRLLTLDPKDRDNTTDKVFTSILQYLQTDFPVDAQVLLEAKFLDDQLLSHIHFIEYFKFLDDNVYIYLIGRCLVLSDGVHVIAVNTSNMYFSDYSFMKSHKHTFKYYLQRFGFTTALKMKQIEVPVLQNVLANESGDITFMCNGHAYRLDSATGDYQIQMPGSTTYTAISQQYNRYVVKQPLK